MAVTETIQELLQGIDDAQYGRDMRQYIHKGIQKCYEEGSAGETDLVAREQVADLQEDLEELRSTMISNFMGGQYDISDDWLLKETISGGNITTSALVGSETIAANGEVYFGITFANSMIDESNLTKMLFLPEYRKINGTTVSISNELEFEYYGVLVAPNEYKHIVFKATNTSGSSISLGRLTNNRIVVTVLFAYLTGAG